MSAENTRRINNLLKEKVTYNFRLKDLKKLKLATIVVKFCVAKATNIKNTQ